MLKKKKKFLILHYSILRIIAVCEKVKGDTDLPVLAMFLHALIYLSTYFMPVPRYSNNYFFFSCFSVLHL